MIRDDIKAATITSMKAGDLVRTGTLRLIASAIKNRDIELRTGTPPADDDVLVAEVLSKMAKQRRESIEMYVQGNRPELADAERAELGVIEGFMPAQMSAGEAQAKIREIVTEVGATSVKDMGKVMALVKERFAGQIDMGTAGAMVKVALAG
ncbi:GatB/YqeY domain-containing protein [Sandarakinorhabdus sp. DWP1-3-1]|uniref:GatB/YqeY domain-containing protein n=1 Tax=Sandarakinorhabdus sp. DWP1-3-1 TaxID=2804627 RepID=UPI003CE687B8